jgi:S-adenosyl methyltransferase
MTGQWFPGIVPSRGEPVEIDTTVAHQARIYNYWLGGKDNFAADREAAEEAIAANPGIVAGVRTNRAFLRRAVQYLAGEAGIRQFLDIGTGIPTADNTHEVAQEVAPECRVVYVDNDPIVLAHARALLTSTPEGSTGYLDADLREVGTIVDRAAHVLDLTQPVAIMLLMILQVIPDSDDPYGIVARLLAAVPAGSYLTVSHPASDHRAQMMADMAKRLNQRMAGPRLTPRSHAEVSRFFDGLEMLDPGLVAPAHWRPDPRYAIPEAATGWCGVARKAER